VAAKLPGMVEANLITPNEASWLGSIRNRKLAAAAVGRIGGKPAVTVVKTFSAQVVELAFVRDRIDRGFGDQRVYALLDDETQTLRAIRAAAARPTLQWLATYRIPG
jgi:protease PrsW